ncbi:hypothetical protein F5050DRAFT_1735667 [Lentinula boryana]|uniref:Uncharacterized protein n=1 Tax=Lentinula boryana TaxID=40481 RepID=A0ABQ8QMZ3_9AGAR|nr:hypothetical protein F5050DRAFT_1735667 [Lentinula boryana]
MVSMYLQHQIDSDSARWIRHLLRGANANALGFSPSPLSPSKPIAHLPAKIKQCYAEIEQLSAEKIAIAEQVVVLITRTHTRLGADLNSSRVLQGKRELPFLRQQNVRSLLPALLQLNYPRVVRYLLRLQRQRQRLILRARVSLEAELSSPTSG